MKFFSKIGSIVGSNSSSTFSKRQGNPNFMQFSNGFKNTFAPSFKLRTFIYFSSLFLIQVTAYNYGSIHNGHLDALVVKIPFYIDNSSPGKVSDAHYDFSTSLVSKSSN